MRWLLALLTSLPLFAATGDVLSGAVLENGWIAVLRIDGGATNGTFDFGFQNATNHTFNGGEKFKMTVNSQGHASTGATNVWQGTLYGTSFIRFAYPDEDFPRVYIDGTDAVIYIALDDFVYLGDTGMAATIGAGLYTSSSATNNSASLTLTNWSTQPHPKVVANWSRVFNNQISNTTMRVSATGWHASANYGQPLAAMIFYATDESGDVVTNTETRMRLDRDMGDLLPTGEYYSDIDISGLTQSNFVRCDFRAVPVRGDTASVFDTRDNTFSWPTYLPSSRTNFYYTNAYGSVAVASAAGNDTNGRPYPHGTDPTTIPSGERFLTGSKAAHAIRTNNLALYGHDTVGSGIVYYMADSDRPFGSTAFSFGDMPKTWITLKNYPGDTVVWTNVTGTDDISDRVKVEGITISPSSTDIMFLNITNLWFDNCIFNAVAAGPIRMTSGTGIQYLTRINITSWGAADIPFGAENYAVGLMRACRLDGFNSSGGIIWYNAIGNIRTPAAANANFLWRDDKASHGVAIRDYQICYNNYLTGITNSTAGTVGLLTGIAHGKAVIQNVWETTHNASSFSVVSEGTLNATNVIWMHNICIGARNQWFYNPSPVSTGAVMNLNTIKHSVAMVLGEATDIDGPTFDADRTNDWSMRHRVSGSGVVNLITTNTFTHNDPMFNGMRSFRPVTAVNDKTPLGWSKFVDDRSFGSGANPAVSQNGNYRLQTRSPILEEDYTHLFWGVPFDMDGLPRGKFDPPGAFAAGNYRRGGFF